MHHYACMFMNEAPGNINTIHDSVTGFAWERKPVPSFFFSLSLGNIFLLGKRSFTGFCYEKEIMISELN